MILNRLSNIDSLQTLLYGQITTGRKIKTFVSKGFNIAKHCLGVFTQFSKYDYMLAAL